MWYKYFPTSHPHHPDKLERIHHNQELLALGTKSFAIIQTVLRKLEPRNERTFIEDVNKTMKLVRYADGAYSLDVEATAELDRPPMASLASYHKSHPK